MRSVVSLFSGAGGLDIGLERAGYDIRLCVENDPSALDTLRHNRRTWPVANPGDIEELEPSELLRQADLVQGELTLLAGGPPCQPYSKAAYWVNGKAPGLSDPRAASLTRYLAMLESTLPEVFILENVLGLASSNDREPLALLNNQIGRVNESYGTQYDPVMVKLNAADFGVPQRRERIFIIGARKGIQMSLPAATHAPPDDESRSTGPLMRWTTAWDAIGHLDSADWNPELQPTGKWARLLPSIPEGRNYLYHTPEGGGLPLFGWRTRYWSFLLKLAKNLPSWTIQASPGPATGPFHWRNRRLSISELSRLQTFPDSYEVQGDYRAAHRQIGNAVPPAIGELIGQAIRHQVLGEPHFKDPRLSLIPHQRADCPSPEIPEQVDESFKELVADHSPHPGVGLGPRASRSTVE